MNEQIRERIERIADEIHDEISDILPDSVWDNCRVGREVMKQIHEAVLKRLSALTAFAEEEQKDTELLREARLALKAAMIPLAVLVITEHKMPYVEHGIDLKREIQSGHDAVCQMLMKITDAHKAWLEKLDNPPSE